MTKNAVVHDKKPATPPAAGGKLLMSPEVVPEQRLGWCRHLPPMPSAYELPAARQIRYGLRDRNVASFRSPDSGEPSTNACSYRCD